MKVELSEEEYAVLDNFLYDLCFVNVRDEEDEAQYLHRWTTLSLAEKISIVKDILRRETLRH